MVQEEFNIVVSFQGKIFEGLVDPSDLNLFFSDEIVHPEISEYNDYSEWSEFNGTDENTYSTDLFKLMGVVGEIQLKKLGRVIVV